MCDTSWKENRFFHGKCFTFNTFTLFSLVCCVIGKRHSVSMENFCFPGSERLLTLSSGRAPSILQGCITPSPPSGTGANLVPRPSGCRRLQQHKSSKSGDTAQESGEEESASVPQVRKSTNASLPVTSMQPLYLLWFCHNEDRSCTMVAQL